MKNTYNNNAFKVQNQTHNKTQKKQKNEKPKNAVHL